ncbi:hypothetical protein [Vitiosangium sp. GDMCC 1.1324]|uniref:hypothetical protein n=1 Tax=Vitiosangium sp. (strain GDMCC 1.1324) TaxID=2138576 RepID=UPI000D346B54|nr:hypothetical protein [Vitiosangium sp. GDMCC 1.1324]PTL76664.1 hypothetical protein DAT35_47865 [Vitiosangium sp. GDMCC 1.1324]
MRVLLTSPSKKVLLLIAAISAVLTTALAWKLLAIDHELKPYTIVSYEFAGSTERATQMFSAWGEAGREAARESLRYDVPYLLVYPFLFFALTLLAARSAPGKLALLGTWLAVAPFAAAVFDALEDLALWRALDQFQQPPGSLLQFAAIAAGVKFLLLGASGLYALVVGCLYRWR